MKNSDFTRSCEFFGSCIHILYIFAFIKVVSIITGF